MSDLRDELAALLRVRPESWEGSASELTRTCALEELPGLARLLFEGAGARLSSVVAHDHRTQDASYGLRYIFSLDQKRAFVHLCAQVPETLSPRFPSITAGVPAAHAFEREIQEFFGLVPDGHPDSRGLILHEDWPHTRFPLRKDFPSHEKPERISGRKFPFLRVEGDGVFEIPVGPVHAGIIEPGHFRFSVAGEPVIHLEIRLGYVHKGIEKLAEGMDVPQAVFLTERISGDASVAHCLAFCHAVERLAGLEAPPRARRLRVVFAEMERIYNHLGDVAGIVTDVGFPFGAAQWLTLRERVLAQNEKLSGHRLLKGVLKPGGVARDITSDGAAELRDFLRLFLEDLRPIERLCLETESLMDRLEQTGVLEKRIAVDLGGVGPAARASGVDLDLRRDHPYAAYGSLTFAVPVREEGDVSARMRVKTHELQESVSLIRQALEDLPGGDLSVSVERVPEGESMGWAESSRGEILHWLRLGPGGRIDRLKIKSPSFVNWPLLPWAVRGNIVPDFPLINKSFNLSYSGNDR